MAPKGPLKVNTSDIPPYKVKPVRIYDAETWTLKNRNKNKIKAADIKVLRVLRKKQEGIEMNVFEKLGLKIC
jgi:hypothetical protein